jgi:tRNA-specific 2-thiouridylase
VKKRVVIGLSGGVDSSVAALVLKDRGYEVTGLFMRNWHDTTGLLQSNCHWEDDLMFAEMVARKLSIPIHVTDLSEQYRKRVVDYMFAEYERGRTPNPDILCNREIKFDSFVEEARKLGADFVATGHYCRKEEVTRDGKVFYRLLQGIDPGKDQSYFLCQLSQEQLSGALFPVGGLMKQEVRKLAEDAGLATASRKDSQGICFVGKVDLPSFLQQKLAPRDGNVVEITDTSGLPSFAPGLPPPDCDENILHEMAEPFSFFAAHGTIAGRHRGAHFFTVGQRKGMNIGGHKEPLFVIATDVRENIVFTGEGHAHPGLNRKGLFIRTDEIHWIRPDLALNPGETGDFIVRIRYRQPLQEARLFMKKSGLFIIFDKLQRGITPGQFAAWYSEGEVIGSGVING